MFFSGKSGPAVVVAVFAAVAAVSTDAVPLLLLLWFLRKFMVPARALTALTYKCNGRANDYKDPPT